MHLDLDLDGRFFDNAMVIRRGPSLAVADPSKTIESAAAQWIGLKQWMEQRMGSWEHELITFSSGRSATQERDPDDGSSRHLSDSPSQLNGLVEYASKAKEVRLALRPRTRRRHRVGRAVRATWQQWLEQPERIGCWRRTLAKC